jgi:hypothetical protein
MQPHDPAYQLCETSARGAETFVNVLSLPLGTRKLLDADPALRRTSTTRFATLRGTYVKH